MIRPDPVFSPGRGSPSLPEGSRSAERPAWARIRREAGTKDAVLEILGPGGPEEDDVCQTFSPLDAFPGRWSIHSGPAETGLPLAAGDGPGSFPLPGAGKEHRLFSLRLQDQVYCLAERRLPLEGGWNVRDLGGFAGADGQRTVWGKILRADDLKDLTPADQAYLSGLPLRTVLDFRLEEEAALFPDLLHATVRRRLARPILAGGRNPAAAAFSGDEADAFMLDIYRHLALDEKPQAVYRELFQLLQGEEDAPPLLFHCSAGKDRTGLAAALVLFSLGVSPETVLRDYLASRWCLAGKYPSSAGIFSVREIYLQAALEAITGLHGSLDDYLENVLGVDRERMRRLYLERMPRPI